MNERKTFAIKSKNKDFNEQYRGKNPFEYMNIYFWFTVKEILLKTTNINFVNFC